MDAQFGLYPWFYANRKSLLFPLIEKYTSTSLSGKTHGEVISIYLDLLKTNSVFRSELDSLIAAQGYKNAGGVDPVSAIAGALGSIADIFTSSKNAQGASDTAFAQAVLEAQKGKNTQTLLIVGGIALASLGLIGFTIYTATKQK
jgi:hypothetical protein